MTLVRTSLYLDAEIQNALKHAAKRLGKSQTEIVNEALAAFLAKASRPRFESLGSGEDEEVTARDSERWLRQHWGRDK